MVTGIFQQTLAGSVDVVGLADNFSKRILAMANANALLVRGGNSGADLAELAKVQLAAFMSGGRVGIGGPPIALPIALAQPIALALNELGTNAIKYGSLSVPDGRVDLNWTQSDGAQGKCLRLAWVERNGPLVGKPKRSGLGTRLIERGIPGAKVERTFDPTGFNCVIEVGLRDQA